MVCVNRNVSTVLGLGMLSMFGNSAGDGSRVVDFHSLGFFLFFCKSMQQLGWDVKTCLETFGAKLIPAQNILLTEVALPFCSNRKLFKIFIKPCLMSLTFIEDV